jgi:hypothetical protein
MVWQRVAVPAMYERPTDDWSTYKRRHERFPLRDKTVASRAAGRPPETHRCAGTRRRCGDLCDPLQCDTPPCLCARREQMETGGDPQYRTTRQCLVMLQATVRIARLDRLRALTTDLRFKLRNQQSVFAREDFEAFCLFPDPCRVVTLLDALIVQNSKPDGEENDRDDPPPTIKHASDPPKHGRTPPIARPQPHRSPRAARKDAHDEASSLAVLCWWAGDTLEHQQSSRERDRAEVRFVACEPPREDLLRAQQQARHLRPPRPIPGDSSPYGSTELHSSARPLVDIDMSKNPHDSLIRTLW